MSTRLRLFFINLKDNHFMKLFLSIIIILFLSQVVYADVSSYIDSYTKYFENESYKSFSQIVKGQASISDIEKQVMLDKEVSQELNTNFIYSDMAECINIALDKNYDIKINKAQKDEIFWLNKNAQVQFLPDIFYNFDIKNLGGKYLVGGIVATTTHEVPIQSIVGFEWSTINQGRYFFNLAQTRNFYKAALFDYEFTKEQTILNTVNAYYDLLSMKRQIEVQKMNLYNRVEQLKYTKARFDAGIGTLYDVKRAQAEVAGAQQEYTTAVNSLRLLQGHLANVMGVNILDSIYPFEIVVDIRELIDPSVDIEKLYEFALSAREDVKAKEAEIRAYKAQKNANFADIIPAVTVSYQNGLVGNKRSGLAPHNSITLDVRASLGKNLLAGTLTQIKADKELVEQKKLELINLKRQIKEDILNSYYDSENSLKKIEASKVEVEAADISLELSIANMKAGDATFIDVIASQNLKVQANINLIKNMIEYNKAQTKLLFDIGILSPKNVLKDYKTRFY
ncbi:TolC family protein [bacterium]|nr:TolC family protein [bacterium]